MTNSFSKSSIVNGSNLIDHDIILLNSDIALFIYLFREILNEDTISSVSFSISLSSFREIAFAISIHLVSHL